MASAKNQFLWVFQKNKRGYNCEVIVAGEIVMKKKKDGRLLKLEKLTECKCC